MENYYEKLKELFQNQHPDKVQQVLANTPLADSASQLTSAPPNTNLNIPSANSVPSSFDVNVSDNTVTQNGNLPTMSAPTTPPDLSQEATPPTPTPTPAPAPAASDDDDSDEDTSSAAKPVKKDAASGLVDPNNDNLKRQAMIDELNRRKKLNILPEGLAAASDAVAGAASAFGANVSQGHQKAQQERDEANIADAKSQFESKLKNDPNSDVSKQYQLLLGKFLQKDPSDPAIAGRSAAQIAEQIPAIEKLAAMQNQKDLKELQLKQMQQNKELQMMMMNTNRQDKLEKQGREWVDNLSKSRNGQVGVQDGKVNQAIHLMNLMDQYKDKNGNYNIPNAQYTELAMGLANLISPTGQSSEGTRQELETATAKQLLNKLTTYAGMDPTFFPASTQSVFQNLRHSIERQGTVAEDERNRYIDQQKNTLPSGLNEEQRQKLIAQNFGNSAYDYIARSRAKSQAPNAATPGASSAPVSKTINGKTYIQKDGKWYAQ